MTLVLKNEMDSFSCIFCQILLFCLTCVYYICFHSAQIFHKFVVSLKHVLQVRLRRIFNQCEKYVTNFSWTRKFRTQIFKVLSAGFRIRWLYPLKRGNSPTKNLHLFVRLQFWRSKECEVLCYWHYPQVHYDPEPLHMLRAYLWIKYINLIISRLDRNTWYYITVNYLY